MSGSLFGRYGDPEQRLRDEAAMVLSLQADLAAARAEADRLRAAVEKVLDFARHGGDPLRAMAGLRDALEVTTTDTADSSVIGRT